MLLALHFKPPEGHGEYYRNHWAIDLTKSNSNPREHHVFLLSKFHFNRNWFRFYTYDSMHFLFAISASDEWVKGQAGGYAGVCCEFFLGFFSFRLMDVCMYS